MKKKRKLKINKIEEGSFLNDLFKIGYSKKNSKDTNKAQYLKKLVKTFQRKFRQELIDGKIDQECLLIAKNLINKYN